MLFGDEHEISRVASAEAGEEAASEGPDVPVTPNVSKAAASAGLAVRTGSNSTVCVCVWCECVCVREFV